ncbi:hypothetical protein LNP74_03515 [Klebsiella pneumoniae subsp. pneumoniae]|nr:hypothetical protein [Klebsiella pneumoniae subsp. pneumoniae]
MADKVTVRTRAAGDKPENGVFWESAGEGEYTVADITQSRSRHRNHPASARRRR